MQVTFRPIKAGLPQANHPDILETEFSDSLLPEDNAPIESGSLDCRFHLTELSFELRQNVLGIEQNGQFEQLHHGDLIAVGNQLYQALIIGTIAAAEAPPAEPESPSWLDVWMQPAAPSSDTTLPTSAGQNAAFPQPAAQNPFTGLPASPPAESLYPPVSTPAVLPPSDPIDVFLSPPQASPDPLAFLYGGQPPAGSVSRSAPSAFPASQSLSVLPPHAQTLDSHFSATPITDLPAPLQRTATGMPDLFQTQMMSPLDNSDPFLPLLPDNYVPTPTDRIAPIAPVSQNAAAGSGGNILRELGIDEGMMAGDLSAGNIENAATPSFPEQAPLDLIDEYLNDAIYAAPPAGVHPAAARRAMVSAPTWRDKLKAFGKKIWGEES